VQQVVLVAQHVGNGLFFVLGLVSLRTWWKRRDAASAWAFATFGTVAVVVLVALFLPDDPHGRWLDAVVKVLLLVLFLFPYSLYRFSAAFEVPSRVLDRAALALTAAVLVVTLFIPHLPGPDEPRPPWMAWYLGLALVQWTVLSLAVVFRLWRAGSSKPTVARRRMRLLSLAAALLNITLLTSAATPSQSRDRWIDLVQALLSALSGVLFYLGVAPPRLLRQSWRRPEEDALQAAVLRMMAVRTAEEVADNLVPPVVGMLGARAGALLSPEGEVLAVRHADRSGRYPTVAGELPAEEPTLRVNLLTAALVVWTSPHTPYFGREELDLVDRFGVVADLALARCALLQQQAEAAELLRQAAEEAGAAYEREREARESLERANAELESFVYSVSHDLKSPMISLLGYLDYLNLDFGDQLPAEAKHYVDRMAVSGAYMQALIHDLLELSRVGRVQRDVEPVDMGAVLGEVTEVVGSTHPGLVVRSGPLPVLLLNGLRARQLLTNLVANAVHHADGPAVEVTVSATAEEDGGVTLVVQDDGPGIAPQYREKVFGVFERLAPRDAPDSGTGIGLAICRKIVESAGGTIAIADAERGTRVCARFPAGSVRSAPAAEPAEAAS
jgi:signal transduction histidine kinase